MTELAPPPVALPSRRQLAVGSVVTVTVAAVALVFFVLPAELGIDPTGFGKATGLTGLAQSGSGTNLYLERGQARTNVLFPIEPAVRAEDVTVERIKDGSLVAPVKPDEAMLRSVMAQLNLGLPAGTKLRSDHWEYELLPYESIEMKYRLAEGQPMIFSWRATAPVHVDMHSVPDQGGNDATESFVINDAQAAQAAAYVAPFTGIHGWFWQNRTLGNVKVTIDATGGFTGAVIFDPAGEHPRQLAPGS